MKITHVMQQLVIVSFGVFAHSACFSNTGNLLNKIYHHKGGGIELGTLSLYFTQRPTIEKPQQSQVDSRNQLIFFFPHIADLSNEARLVMKQLNNVKPGSYAISIQQLQGGVQVKVSYDPNLVDIKYDSFESIGSQKGLDFTFYDKKLLERLGNKSNKSVLKTASLQKPRKVVVDCGHGGSDSGTIGFFQLKEKDITLEVGLQVAKLLHKEGVEVVLTRNEDCDVALDERTSKANKGADLFVSIHANSSKNSAMHGIETYWLNNSLFNECFSTLSGKFQQCVSLLEKEIALKSERLATSLHRQVLALAQKKNSRVIDRHVRSAVSQVLLGTTMPAVLMEIGFLSNPDEAKLLNDQSYQALLAQGICRGILTYFDTSNVA